MLHGRIDLVIVSIGQGDWEGVAVLKVKKKSVASTREMSVNRKMNLMRADRLARRVWVCSAVERKMRIGNGTVTSSMAKDAFIFFYFQALLLLSARASTV